MKTLLFISAIFPLSLWAQLTIQGPVYGEPTATVTANGTTAELPLSGKKKKRFGLDIQGYNHTERLHFEWPDGRAQSVTIYAQLPPGADQNREWVYIIIGENNWTESVIYYSPFQRQFVHAETIHPQDQNAWNYWNKIK